MEMGSGSGGLPASSDSLNGLKFGQKIYFEDAQGITSTGGSSSLPVAAMAAPSHAPPPAAAHKKEKGQQQQQQPPPHPPPRCQVEGCNVDLTGAKSYYCRHKVCAMHSKFPKVVVAGIEQRFCQQCSRFHRLHEFDQGKRSCRRRLAGHNERRRKPPPGPLSPRFGRLSSSSCEEGSRFRSFLMDFSYPRTQFPSRELWPTVRSIDHAASGGQWQGGSDAPRGAVATHPYIQPASHYCSELPPSECLAGVSDSSCALSLLSSQPWGTTVAPRGRAPNIPASSGLNGPLMGQQMVVTSTCAAHPWGFKNHGAGSSNQEILHGVGLGHYDDDDDGNGRFSRELELALEGNGHCPDHGPVRAYDHSGHGMHWSL